LAVIAVSGCDRLSRLLPGRSVPDAVDVVVVGAGLAGLIAAYRLERAGKSVVILEATPRIGGRIRTARYDGKVGPEIGLEELWTGNPALEVAQQLQLPVSRHQGSLSSFRDGGVIHSNRAGLGNREFVRSFLSPEEFAAFVRWDDRVIELDRRIRDDPRSAAARELEAVSFASWVRDTSGLSPRAQEFVRVTSEPEYATSWERISALEGIIEWRIFAGEGAQPHHIRGGNARLVDAIADNLGAEKILLDHQVTHITSSAEGVEVVATNTATFAQYAVRGKFVVTAIPLYRLYDIQFDPPLSDEIRKAVATQAWGAYFTAHVFLDAPVAEIARGTLAGATLPVLSDGPLGVIYPTGSPQILNLLVHGDYAEGFNTRTVEPDAIRAALLAAFDELSPGFSPHVGRMTFYRFHPRAIASWPVGRSRFDELAEVLRKPYGRVYFAGDFTEGTHSDGAAWSAIRVTEQIRWAWGVSK
jgi:monoamine oxidase